jgi:hypothetical protein
MASMNHQKGLKMQGKSNKTLPERINRTTTASVTGDAL